MPTIDIGNEAIDRPQYTEVGWTQVDKNNPANATGVITSVEIFVASAMTGCEVATFSASGNNLTTRDTVSIGDVSTGYHQYDVSLNVVSGDYIGIYFITGTLDATTGASTGRWYKSGDNIPCTNTTFTAQTNVTLSIYATGITVPAQVTNVLATDGTYTDKVTVTWDVADGATKYYVWNGSSWVDVGNVLTWNDTNAPAPTITAGVGDASDGTSSDYVTCSVSGESANNGSSISYKVKAWNAVGYGTESSTNSGYRGVGALTYQWQRSTGDSDGGYSNINLATTDPYNDTDAPADGSGRYYKCVEDATGATQQISTVDRGYRTGVAPSPTYNYFGHN